MRHKIILLILLMCSIPLVVIASPFKYDVCNLGWQHVHHEHSEASYQQAWCSLHGGVMEYENTDKTRVDCLTDTHAVEFDFANKWHESIGQALHYSVMTGKRAKVVLILDEPDTQIRYFERIKKISVSYNFDVEYVTDEILRLDKDCKCNYSNCKCHKINQECGCLKI